jgi:hypothetical protein
MTAMNKEHILKEVRRTTEANGGVPLGRKSFFRETGIKEADWQGKLWARWGDVVREAGFEPNKKQAAFSDDTLIAGFIAVMRELGRFPVSAELRLMKRDNASVPNDKTLRRLGSKQQLVAKILGYCQERAGHEDIVELCSAVLDSGSAVAEDDAELEEGSIGFVYLMKSGRSYKIGRSNATGRREYELAIQLPEKLRTVHTIRTDDPVGIEEYWHKRFAAKRKGLT